MPRQNEPDIYAVGLLYWNALCTYLLDDGNRFVKAYRAEGGIVIKTKMEQLTGAKESTKQMLLGVGLSETAASDISKLLADNNRIKCRLAGLNVPFGGNHENRSKLSR